MARAWVWIDTTDGPTAPTIWWTSPLCASSDARAAATALELTAGAALVWVSRATMPPATRAPVMAPTSTPARKRRPGPAAPTQGRESRAAGGTGGWGGGKPNRGSEGPAGGGGGPERSAGGAGGSAGRVGGPSGGAGGGTGGPQAKPGPRSPELVGSGGHIVEGVSAIGCPPVGRGHSPGVVPSFGIDAPSIEGAQAKVR